MITLVYNILYSYIIHRTCAQDYPVFYSENANKYDLYKGGKLKKKKNIGLSKKLECTKLQNNIRQTLYLTR